MYVIIIGGGKVGYYLSQEVRRDGHEVTVLERDPKRYQLIVRELGDMVTLGDGCEVRTMQEAGMNRADVVVAVTGHDEDNLVICQMAKNRFQVPRTVARVNNPRNEQIFRDLGVDETLNSTRIIFNLIMQEVDTGDIIPLSTLQRGNIELVEVELSAKSPVVGKMVKNIALPGDTVLAAIIREDQILLPSGTTDLRLGDEVIALTRLVDEPKLRDLLAGDVHARPST